MNNDDHRYVLSIVTQRLARAKEQHGGLLQEGVIEQYLDKELTQDEYDVDRTALLAELESNFATLIGSATSLHDRDDHPKGPWVSTMRTKDQDFEWFFWNRYREYLLQTSWPEPVVSRLDKTTTEILDSMMQPNSPGRWDQRGLVVGHVQSGKTANYIGLICKAVDAGYKVVIVLAGVHNSLRTQTQIRLEEGFLGYKTINEDIERRQPTGVGELPFSGIPVPDTLTTRGERGDFRTAVARNTGINPGGNPLLFVVKKNTTVLKNLYNWVDSVARTQGHSRNRIEGVPLLMIDDESDYASVDTKKQGYDEGDPDPEHDPTKINGLIRKILSSFEQSIYIGYTATPFANIFIPEKAHADAYKNDLFPRSFIFSLKAASNYVGSVKMFGLNDNAEELPIFRTVEDHAESLSIREREGWIPPLHNKLHTPRYRGEITIPPSLRKAIRTFVIATASRKARGHLTSHNSMLIHVTRFVDVQSKVKEQVEDELLHIRDRVMYGDGDRKPSMIDNLRGLWNEDIAPTSAAINEPDCKMLQWADIEPHLKLTVQSIVVRGINGTSGEALEYARHRANNQPYDVIAIGGDKLSRGLTLEGLTVSYFLRHSKMYDTLMQMGRWFGYRPGYLDLCRIFTTANLQKWFRHISVASEELRDDFNRMVISGCTPRQFGHRVLCHPQLMVTSPAKMRHSETRTTSFDGCPAETTLFQQETEIIHRNYGAIETLMKGLVCDADDNDCVCHRMKDTDKYVWKGVSADRVIDFLSVYQGYSAARAHPHYLKDYIQKQVKRAKLVDWTVYLVRGEGEEVPIVPGVSVRRAIRAWHKQPDNSSVSDPYRVRRSGNKPDEYIDFSEEEMVEGLRKTISIWKHEGSITKKPEKPRGPGLRATRPPERGLLCLYVLGPKDLPTSKTPFVGFLLSFPVDELATPIKYRVNDVYTRLEEEGIWDE